MKRVILWTALAAGLIAAAVWWWGSGPRPASPSMKIAGLGLALEVLTRLDATGLGADRRGEELVRTVRSLLAEDRVVFSEDLAELAFCFEKPGGSEIWLHTRLIELDDKVGLAKCLLHEAVHVLRPEGASVEEECDAHAAGLWAAAAFEGRELPWSIRISGRSIEAFVRGAYPDLKSDPSYIPVSESRSWLQERTMESGASDGR